MTADPLDIGTLKAKQAYLHLVFALFQTPPDSGAIQFIGELESWLNNAPEAEIRARSAELNAALEPMMVMALKHLPPKIGWRQIAAEYRHHLDTGDFSFSRGIPYGWLAERFNAESLVGPPDIPYHAQVGIGVHAGHVAVEEDFLLRDAYFLLIKCNRALVFLESFRGQKPQAYAREQYRTISVANQNVATHARLAISGFYAFVECLVNSVGEDFVRRNPLLRDTTKELLRGKKDNRYLSIERKIELFPELIRPDGKRPLILSDIQQIVDPYKAFATHIKEVRDASAHYAKTKADILMSPQLWNKKANEAASVCIAVAGGFWSACFPKRSLPVYLGKLDETILIKGAELRADAEAMTIRPIRGLSKFSPCTVTWVASASYEFFSSSTNAVESRPTRSSPSSRKRWVSTVNLAIRH